MIRHLHPPALLMIVAALAPMPQPARATTFVPISDVDLAKRATLVVEGRIAAAEAPSGEASQTLPAVDYRLAVDRVIQGDDPGPEVVVRVPGGVREDGLGLKIWGAPSFQAEERVLLFLTPRRDGAFALHQFLLGAFRIGFADGREVVWRDLEGAHAVELAGKSARPVPRDGVRDLAGFRRFLAARASGLVEEADYFRDDLEPPRPPREKFALISSPTAPPPLGCGNAGGRAVRWFDFDAGTPVPWRIHLSGQRGLPGGGTAELTAAIASWNDDPHTNIDYFFLGETVAPAGLTAPDGRNTLLFEDPNDEIGGSFDPQEGGTLALGGPWFSCELLRYRDRRFHPIREADVVTQDGLFRFFALFEDPSPQALELFAHELGHTLGFAHTAETDALMFAAIHADDRGAAQHADDWAAALFLYGNPADLTAPETPGALSAEAVDADRVILEWVDRSDNETSFAIERRQNSGSLGAFALVTTVAADSTRFVDTSTAARTAYAYRVRAQNGAGRSAPSPTVVVTTPEDQRPEAPTHLWSAALSSDRVRLTWQDNSDDENAFVIEIQLQEGFVEIPVSVPPNTRSVVISGLPPATPFTFRLRARNAFGVSPPTNRATSWTFPTGVDCEATANRLCLAGGRLAVEVQFRVPRFPLTNAAVVPATDEMGFFWFFQPENVELMTRAVEEEDGSLSFTLAGLTSIEYLVRVTDTRSGEVREIVHLSGSFCHPGGSLSFPASVDAQAKLATPAEPLSSAAGKRLIQQLAVTTTGTPPVAVDGADCSTDDETLCLRGGRFATSVAWKASDEPETLRPAIAAAGPPGVAFFAFRDISQPEMVVKLLDGGDFNGHFWVIADSPSELELELSIADVDTGDVRTYVHSAGDCPVVDLFAFPAAP